MRQLSKCYFVVVSVILASTVFSMSCGQYYMSKAPITISCEDPVDEDGSGGFEDDKEYIPLFNVSIHPIAGHVPTSRYQDSHSIHASEITVPPPEA